VIHEHDSLELVPDSIYLSALRFLSKEGSLLDRRDYRGWLALLTDDIHYRVSAQINQDAAAGTKDYAIIDEDEGNLRARVEQIATPKLTHAENPPSLARRFFSSVNVEETEQSNEIIAYSNIMVFRSKPEIIDGGLYAGFREDLLRKVDGQWRLARRFVRLDHSTLYGCVSIIF